MSTTNIMRTLGTSSHTEEDRAEHDYYATDPKVVEMLLDIIDFSKLIWEPACGEGHISKVLQKRGHIVKSTDLITRGFGLGGVDFLNCETKFRGDIITNPPYNLAEKFIYKSLDLIPDGNKAVMLLKIQFLEGKGRKKMFEKFPPKFVMVSSSRFSCAKNGDFEALKNTGGSDIAYAWYVWEKGYTGETIIKWFN